MRQREFFIHYGRQFGTLLGLIVLVVVLWILTPYFLTISNLLNIAQQTAINAIIAVGMTFIIITAGIDLSVGSLLALCNVLMGLTMLQFNADSGLAQLLFGILVALTVGASIGFLNGFISVH